MKNGTKTLTLAQFAILLAIEAVFCFTPLGSLPAIGPIVATLAMIPVVITAILLGTKAGALMGGFAGLFSFLVWTFAPPSPLVAFVFSPFYSLGEFSGNVGSVLICFVPRILVGLVAGLAWLGLSKAFPKRAFGNYMLSAALGSLANTFGVLGGIWLFFGEQYSMVAGQAILAVIGATILTSGIPEALVAAIVAAAVCNSAKYVLAKRSKRA